jgi:thiopurine S-methyltransferase
MAFHRLLVNTNFNFMEQEFWLASWEEGGRKTSFHRRDVHPYILKYLPSHQLKGKRVLVPLCGKSVDLIYFAQHAEAVIGVELAEKAVHQFFIEQALPYTRVGNRYSSGNLTIFQGDFFAQSLVQLGTIDLVYDRAALVALPLEMRLRYIDKIHQLLPKAAQQFVNTLEYAPLKAEPPFSISPSDLQEYYGQAFKIEHLEAPLVPQHGLIRVWGLDYIREHGFLLTRD